MSYQDKELEAFVKRFGTPNVEPKKTILEKPPNEGLLEGKLDLGKQIMKRYPTDNKSIKGLVMPMDNVDTELVGNTPLGVKTSSAHKNLELDTASLMGATASGIQLVDNIKGNQFDTSADGGGPGKAGGAIMSGAASGMQLANSLGLKDPLSQGIAAVGGGLISTFAHSGAMKEYGKNIRKKNLNENALDKVKLDQEYEVSQGKESLGLLKGLRQKQLGIIN